jgi:hypothetical protein
MSTVQLTAAVDNAAGAEESRDSIDDVLTALLGDGAVGADIPQPIVTSAMAMVMMNGPVRVMTLLLMRVVVEGFCRAYKRIEVERDEQMTSQSP